MKVYSFTITEIIRAYGQGAIMIVGIYGRLVGQHGPLLGVLSDTTLERELSLGRVLVIVVNSIFNS